LAKALKAMAFGKPSKRFYFGVGVGWTKVEWAGNPVFAW
jgi:hypothetical protein